MPPAVGRLHAPHMSNPFQHLNPQHAIPASAHYQSQSQSAATFNPPHTAFPSGNNSNNNNNNALNGSISPFNPTSAYGGSAFSTGAVPTTFNNGNTQGQGLASVAAQQGFARGAAMQEHTHQAEAASLSIKSGAVGRIREVWQHNLDSEMAVLRQLITAYPYVSMDAEFPGIVARPIGNFAGSKAEYHYQTLRCNVDILKPIQVGITLWTPDGELPPVHPDSSLFRHTTHSKPPLNHSLLYLPCTWVFNLHFNLEEDMYAESSIELLKSSGVDFDRHASMGIPHSTFGSLLTTSGLAFSPTVNWLSFHSGYDFGYLVKLLTDAALPPSQADFFALVTTFFPKLWDIKFLLRQAQRLRSLGRLGQEGSRILDALGSKSGLADLAEELSCVRIGAAHTGGSDAWLTGMVFWAMRSKIFSNALDEDLADQIYGLHGVGAPASQQFRDEFFAAQQGTPVMQAAQGVLQGGALGYTPSGGVGPSTPTSSHAGAAQQGQTPGYTGTGQGHGGQGSLGGGGGGGGFRGF